MFRTYEEKKIEFNDSCDVTKCSQQIEIPDLLHMCATCSELSSNTMDDSNGCQAWLIRK